MKFLQKFQTRQSKLLTHLSSSFFKALIDISSESLSKKVMVIFVSLISITDISFSIFFFIL